MPKGGWGTFSNPELVLEFFSGFQAHTSALISPEATVGRGTTIGPFCIIGRGAVIGENCKLFPHAQVKAGATIGSNCILGDGAKVLSGAIVGNHCVIGENCTVYGKAVLGNGVKMESCSQVWPLVTLEDNVFVGPNATFTNDLTPRADEPKGGSANWVTTLVRQGASLGANCTIVCGKTIGTYAVIAAGSVVARDIPSFTLAVGVPARVRYEVCAKNHGAQKWIKLVLEGDISATCPTCNRHFKRFGAELMLQLTAEALQ